MPKYKFTALTRSASRQDDGYTYVEFTGDNNAWSQSHSEKPWFFNKMFVTVPNDVADEMFLHGPWEILVEAVPAVPPEEAMVFKVGDLVEVNEPVGAHGTGFVVHVRPSSTETTYDIMPRVKGLGPEARGVPGRYLKPAKDLP
jgi:hypothetical protein